MALRQAAQPEFKEYARRVIANCASLTKRLQEHGYSIVSGGTDNHLALVDLRPNNLNGAKVERIMELANIALNKNTVRHPANHLGFRLLVYCLTFGMIWWLLYWFLFFYPFLLPSIAV